MYTKYNFFLIQEKVLNSFPRLPLELFVWQWFSIKYIFSERGDFLRIIAIALLHIASSLNDSMMSMMLYIGLWLFWDSNPGQSSLPSLLGALKGSTAWVRIPEESQFWKGYTANLDHLIYLTWYYTNKLLVLHAWFTGLITIQLFCSKDVPGITNS